MEIVRAIKEGRKDLTDFVIHFTRYQDGSNSFEILRKIVQDGYFKCGWSYRGTKDTVLGEKPAVCFTETPLYGFLDYVKKRKNVHAIDSYGISLYRKELFNAGGRSVIYGTSLEPAEITINGRKHIEGFPSSEQYRYILTLIDQKNDWMHEREWRWANWRLHSKDDGIMPLWNIQSVSPNRTHYFKFCPIGIIVHEQHEADIICNILLEHYEQDLVDYRSEMKQFGNDQFIEHRLFSPDAIQCTKIIVLNTFTELEKKELAIESIIRSGKVISIFELLKKKYNVDHL